MISLTAPSRAFVLACALASAGASCDRVAEPERAVPKIPPQHKVSDESIAPSVGSDARRPPCIAPAPEAPPAPQGDAAECPEPPRPIPEMPRGSVTFPEAPGSPRVAVELARTPFHRAHGLMFRRELAPGLGMLFSWDREEPRSFWMRNTCLSLDMLFIATDGTIVGMLEHVPPMNDEPRRVPCEAQHVLEVPAGWSREQGIAPGQRLEIAEH